MAEYKSHGPQDALEGSDRVDPSVLQGNDPQVPMTGAPSPVLGPEDALDPHVENAGDYSSRVEDAAHYTGVEVPHDEREAFGPHTTLLPQNQQAAGEVESKDAAPLPAEPEPEASRPVEANQVVVEGERPAPAVIEPEAEQPAVAGWDQPAAPEAAAAPADEQAVAEDTSAEQA